MPAGASPQVLRRKRVPGSLKLEQLDTFLREAAAARGRSPAGVADTADGGVEWGDEALRRIDIDAVFKIEKRDKAHLPRDRAWFRPAEWT